MSELKHWHGKVEKASNTIHGKRFFTLCGNIYRLGGPGLVREYASNGHRILVVDNQADWDRYSNPASFRPCKKCVKARKLLEPTND